MVDEERELADVLMQIAAAKAALGRVAALLMDAQVRHLVQQAVRSDDQRVRERTITELLDVFDKHCSS